MLCSRFKEVFLHIFLSLALTSCYNLQFEHNFRQKKTVPAVIQEYYRPTKSYFSWSEVFVIPTKKYSVRRFELTSNQGEIVIDCYLNEHGSKQSLVLIFPILGGKNVIEAYFADYLASRGISSAIIHRTEVFKDPRRINDIEKILRENIIRDRIALDFIEKELGFKKIGGFGLSRGAMNLAMTAGIDKRLEYNFLALGGANLVRVIWDSKESRIKDFIGKISKIRKEPPLKTKQFLESVLVTQPENLAIYMNPNKTKLLLARFDTTVPFKEGLILRNKIGNPETVIIPSGHATSLLFTNYFLPLNYGLIERSVFSFFKDSLD